MKNLFLLIVVFCCMYNSAFAQNYNLIPPPKGLKEKYVSSYSANSNFQIDANFISFDFQKSRIYSQSNIGSTLILFEKSKVIPSLDLLFPGFVYFGSFFNAYPDESELLFLIFLNLLNGETGLRYANVDIGFHNSFHLFYTRRVYHKSGLKFNFKYVELMFYELDRLDSRRPKFGIELGYTFTY